MCTFRFISKSWCCNLSIKMSIDLKLETTRSISLHVKNYLIESIFIFIYIVITSSTMCHNGFAIKSPHFYVHHNIFETLLWKIWSFDNLILTLKPNNLDLSFSFSRDKEEAYRFSSSKENFHPKRKFESFAPCAKISPLPFVLSETQSITFPIRPSKFLFREMLFSLKIYHLDNNISLRRAGN